MHHAHAGATRASSGRNGDALVFTSANSARRWIADPESVESEPSFQVSTKTAGLYSDSVFSSRRQLNLHAYNPKAYRMDYVETKIGGHPLDHRILLESESQRKRPYGPLKTLTISFGSNQSLAYEAREKPALVYAPVKIGGHALDHVRFFDKGRPSRPLWGFALLPTPAVLVYPRRPQPLATGAPPILEHIPRGLSNLYSCGCCQRMRQSPRVQLCCGHALCASCLSSDDLRHVVVPTSSACFLECLQCNDYVAMEAVVFPPGRILHVDHTSGSPRTLEELRQRGRVDMASQTSGLRWRSGSALAALALVAAGKLLSPKALKTKSKPTPVAEDATFQEVLEAASADRSVDAGRSRWQKRIAGLHAPSKLLKFSFVRSLGLGNFAEVMLVRDRKGALCVLKESDKLQEAVNEIGILSKIRSPHVVEIHEYFVEEIGHRHFAYIAMEYCDQGDLLQQLQRDGAMDATAFDRVFRQVCIGLTEIHACGIIHRDLKPSNVLLTSEGIVKIADFGVSTCLESDLLTHHAAGTLAFMAPEVRRYFLGENVSYDAKADIWSLGALAMAMLSGDPEPRVATRVADEVVEEVVEKHSLSELHAELLRKTLDQDPTKRPSLAELLDMVPQMSARL